MVKTSDAQIRASMKYNKTHKKHFPLDINIDTEQDILERLNTVPYKQTYIKELIRQDIAARPNLYDDMTK